MAAKSSVDSACREIIARMLTPLPPTKTKQIGPSINLSDIDSEVNDLGTKLGKDRQIKQEMMQLLLTGRIRPA